MSTPMDPTAQDNLDTPANDPFPIDGGPFRLTVGLRRVPPTAWLAPGPDRAHQLSERRRLLATCPEDVLACTTSAEAATGELLALVRNACGHPARKTSGPTGAEALREIGEIAQEDFCLLQDRASPGVYHLTAAVLCFPNRWRLRARIGWTTRALHAPVPGYDAALAAPVDRVLGGLRAESILMRQNWSLHPSPTLFQPEPDPAAHHTSPSPETVGTRVFLRIERQTLRRLPDSGAIAFGIRTRVMALEHGIRTAEARACLATALQTMSDEMAAYKGLSALKGPILEWLCDQDGVANR